MKKLILMAVMAVIVFGCNSSSSKESVIESGIKCAIISEDFVKAVLKYPEEAEFKTRNHIHEINGSTAIVLNKFIGKNSFGTKITYTYKIWLRFNGGEWEDKANWQCDNLILEGSDGTKETFY